MEGARMGSIVAVMVALVFPMVNSVDSSSLVDGDKVSPQDQARVMDFARNYGYLVKSDDARLGRLRSKTELEEAIKGIQRFAGIKVTGKVDAMTMKIIKTSRCGIADFGPTDNTRRRKRYALQGSRWRKNALTYRILNDATQAVSKTQIDTTIRKAFDMWSKVTPLTFRKVSSRDADILISFRSGQHEDGYPFDGQGGTLAHGFYPHNNIGLSGDVHFDDDEIWVLENSRPGTDFLWTAVHEIGHALGLDHSNYRSAIMFPYYLGYKANLKLTEDDILGIQNIYGKPTVDATTSPATRKPVDDGACRTNFDAIFHSKDGNTYFLKDEHFWTVDQYNRRSKALKIKDYWPDLNLRVQAAYTRRDGNTVFFKGRRFWVYNGTKLVAKRRMNSEYGLPDDLIRLDAVFVWGGNGKTYFFKGHQYWRYNEVAKTIDPGYPRNISVGWGAIPSNIDAVMTWKDTKTYFFHGYTFHKYDYRRNQYKPQSIAEYFFRCTDVEFARDGVGKASVLTSLVTLFALLSSVANF